MRLWLRTPAVAAFQAPAWVLSAWDELPRKGAVPYVVVVEQGSELLAVFPLQRHRRGRLTFIGASVSNYSGPVYDPSRLDEIVRAWACHLAAQPDVRTVDLAGLRQDTTFFQFVRDRDLPGLGRALTLLTNTCPMVDLGPGWDRLIREKHNTKTRARLARKTRRLQALGQLDYVELTSPEEVLAELPRCFELFEARWEGQRQTGGFASVKQPFHLEAARRAARQGLVQLSVLQLDGRTIAFLYGVRTDRVLTGCIIAHDAQFNVASPGLLLLTRVLEAGAERGDAAYDFSLGDVPYKAMWSARDVHVFRSVWGRDRFILSLSALLWVRARSVPHLREIKMRGMAAVVQRAAQQESVPADSPGLPAGPEGTWYVHRVPGARTPIEVAVRRLTYRDMKQCLSPRLLSIALDRAFRDQVLLGVEVRGELVGVVWRADGDRRTSILGGSVKVSGSEPVFYHPVAAAGHHPAEVARCVVERRGALVVSGAEISEPGIETLTCFQADLLMRPTPGPTVNADRNQKR
jgi:CelD/BcsL family acetyltransferase involved in cellulose biosynthesis